MPKVSVIIPVYNVEEFLQDCIDSLINQTLDDIELIFVNDASPDNSLQILKENQQKYPEKIVVIDSPENLRQGGARNLGIARASADYIGFVDSDDLVNPSMYQSLYDAIIKTDADAAFISAARINEQSKYGPHLYNDEAINKMLCFNAHKCQEFADQNMSVDQVVELMVTPHSPSVWSGLYKKSIILDNNIYFPEHLKFEDNYWCSLLRCYLSKITIANGVGYYYRYNSNSTVHKKDSPDFLDRVTVEHKLLDEVKRRGFFEKFYDAWEYNYVNRYGMNTELAYITRYTKIPYDKIKELQDDVNSIYPEWKKNRFIKRDTGLKMKLKCILFGIDPLSICGKLVISMYLKYYQKQQGKIVQK